MKNTLVEVIDREEDTGIAVSLRDREDIRSEAAEEKDMN